MAALSSEPRSPERVQARCLPQFPRALPKICFVGSEFTRALMSQTPERVRARCLPGTRNCRAAEILARLRDGSKHVVPQENGTKKHIRFEHGIGEGKIKILALDYRGA